MKRNILRQVAAGMVIIIIMLACFYAGTGVEQKLGKVSDQKTEIIAVVNLDEGVAKQDGDTERNYYSNDLLGYNHTDFEVISLESARNGIVEGRYAAYIILPADFSEKIESVNTNPQKARITYAINPYLDSSVKEEVIKKLEIFSSDMNYDISYLYVSAILNEFHDVQDASEIVLTNDLTDEEELLAVDSDKLIELLTYPELLQVEKEIEDLDFTEIFENNHTIGSEIEEGIKSDLQEGEIAYQDVQRQSVGVFGATEELLMSVDTYHPGYDAEGNLIYQEGINTISENFARYNTLQADTAIVIKTMAREESNRLGVVALERQLRMLQSRINQYISNRQAESYVRYQEVLLFELEDYLDSVNSYYRHLGVSENDLYDYSDLEQCIGAVQRPGPVQVELFELMGGSISENDIQRLTQDQQLSSEFLRVVDQATSVSMNDIIEIVDEQIIDELKKQQRETYRAIQDRRDGLADQIDLYDEAIAEYDPFDYINDERMTDMLEKFKENIDRVETNQQEHDEDYLELMKEIYEVTEENQKAFDENLEASQEITRANIENTIAALQQSKSATTQENKELLETFTKKLAYTRLGSLGNIEAYDFIVSPLNFEENHVEQVILDIQSDYQRYVLMAMAALAVISMLLFGSSILVKKNEGTE